MTSRNRLIRGRIIELSEDPCVADGQEATDHRKTFGEYITTFTSKGGQVRADLFREGRVFVAHASFPTGLDVSDVTDPYVSELRNYAREQGIADNFKMILS